MTPIETFPDHDALAHAAADLVAERLSASDARTFVAAGGSTPGPIYDLLARRDLDWARLTVTLTDERWVDRSADESNENMIRHRLLVGEAGRAAFLSLKGSGDSPQADADVAEAALRDLLPSACVLLGMGADGHIASLFPGAPELAAGLDLDGPRLCLAVPKAGLKPFVPRITLTARALIATGMILVLVTGEDKRAVIERVQGDPSYAPPAATILRQDRAPTRILWAP
jgi:6-phosphogluconolactonase